MTIENLISLALEEDINHGDITTDNLQISQKSCKAYIKAKEEGVLSGIEIARKVFEIVDKNISFISLEKDGNCLQKDSIIAIIEGSSASILKAERVALNFLQRMCGIATETRNFVDEIKHTKCRLLDTRKTTPLIRKLEKYSIKIGGGYNHRFGLYDMVMLKENHIRAVGSISKAVEMIKKNINSYKIEVEVTNLTELEEAVNCEVDRVMLDNMSLEVMKEAVRKYGKQIELEASGNITIKNIKQIAETGVHFISSGALTHSYKSLNISLLFEEKM